MTDQFSITFFLKLEKVKFDGTAPIYVRVWCGKIRTTLTTGKYVLPGK